MTKWTERTLEERVLFNPAFCANVLWHFAAANVTGGVRQLTFVESFLVLPIVLHRATREALPRSTRTSLSVWLDDNPAMQANVATRARVMVPFTKEAILFGGTRGLIKLQEQSLIADMSSKRRVTLALRDSTDEVRLCVKRAGFLGSWFAEAGSATTVMALMGVRP